MPEANRQERQIVLPKELESRQIIDNVSRPTVHPYEQGSIRKGPAGKKRKKKNVEKKGTGAIRRETCADTGGVGQ